MEKLPAIVALAIAVSGLSGCYPTFLTSRPEAKIFVTDESGAPLEGATVTLGTMEWHGVGGRNTRQDFLTDRAGKLEIDDEHEWAVQIVLPDGDMSYSWSLCFSKPGFEAIPMNRPDFDQPIKVAMYASPVNSECEWQERGQGPRVKERDARWIAVEGGPGIAIQGMSWVVDQEIRGALEARAREQGIKLHSWSEYRFQFQRFGDDTGRNRYLLIRAICRAPADVDLTKAFYAEPDDGSCYVETKYTMQVWADQPKSSFGPLKIVAPIENYSGPRSE